MSFTCINEEDIRTFVLDRTPADNIIDGSISFTPEEIAAAMRRAAQAYNSVPPFVHFVQPDQLPGDTDIFLHATAEQLYLAKIAQAARNDFDYSAGGVQANLEATRLKHYKELVKLHGETWRETAKAIKITRNLENAWGFA